MKKPLFSCVIPVKGERPFFDEALASLKSQGMGDDLEIIVQDADIEPDSGQSDALNKGFAKARGEWLFWLNADDVLLPGALKNLTQRLRVTEDCGDACGASGVEWIAGDTIYLDKDGIARDVRTDARWHSWFGRYLSVWTGGPSSFFRRRLLDMYGGFDVDLHYVMDIEMWTRWAKAGRRFVGVDNYIWGFRMHEGSKTMGGRNDNEYFAERMQVLQRCGLGKQSFWRNLARFSSIVDGSWLKRVCDRKRFDGIHWKDLSL